MFPYLIAGAIGFAVAKIFEEDKTPKYADGGKLSNGYKLPKYLYHLTSEKIFNNIKKEGGLNPKYSKQSKGEKGIYLTDDKSVAENYAGFFDAGENLVLLKISTDGMDMSKFTSDDYELQEFLDDGGRDNNDKRIEEYSSWDEVPFELSLEWVNQIQYHKTIPIENIENIEIIQKSTTLNNWKEEINNIIYQKGYVYTFTDYSDWKEIKNKSFQTALSNYKKDLKIFQSVIKSLPKNQKEYLDSVLDEHGTLSFDDVFNEYYTYFDKFNEKFHNARKQYLKSYKSLFRVMNR
jgi:hypothetical protein